MQSVECAPVMRRVIQFCAHRVHTLRMRPFEGADDAEDGTAPFGVLGSPNGAALPRSTLEAIESGKRAKHSPVEVDVVRLQVAKKRPATTKKNLETTLCRLILGVRLQVSSEMNYPLREERDLDRSRARVPWSKAEVNGEVLRSHRHEDLTSNRSKRVRRRAHRRRIVGLVRVLARLRIARRIDLTTLSASFALVHACEEKRRHQLVLRVKFRVSADGHVGSFGGEFGRRIIRRPTQQVRQRPPLHPGMRRQSLSPASAEQAPRRS